MGNTLDYEKFKKDYLESKTLQDKQEVIDLQYQRIQTLSAEESMAEVKMLFERLNQIKAQLLEETTISV
jgi:hypothetical protein